VKTVSSRGTYCPRVRVGVSLAALAAGLALLAATADASRADNPVLTGDVGIGDSFAISLKDSNGRSVTHLDPGTYTLVVHDHSSLHNFRLTGPGVNVATDIETANDSTFTITLTDGTYFFQCDPHAGQMKGKFTVGTVSTPPTPTPAPAPTTLAASIGPGAASWLRPSSGLSAGRFAITVKDASATDGFRLAGPGVAQATGIAFKGTVTWRLSLQAGRYTFGSVRRAALRRAFTIGP
jgi:plastocyanin